MSAEFYLSHPQYGQEGGGVAYTDWKPLSKKLFWTGCDQLFANVHRSRFRVRVGGVAYTIVADAFSDSPKVAVFHYSSHGHHEEPVATLADLKMFLAKLGIA